jgi:tetratricopeptide (TPR) repeat protein
MRYLLSIMMGVVCLAAQKPLAGQAADPPSAKEVEKQALQELRAGQQAKAEHRLHEYVERCQDLADLGQIVGLFGNQKQAEAVELLRKQQHDRYREQQRVIFLIGALERSRFDVGGAFPFFVIVAMTDEKSAVGQCSKTILALDIAKYSRKTKKSEIDQYFADLAGLADANPDDIVIRWMAAVQCRSYDRNEEGIEHYQMIVPKWNPGPVLLHQTYANLLDEVHRYEDALVERRKAVELEPAGWSYDGLGNTLHHLDRYDESCEAHAKAVALDPDRDLYWCNWGIVLNSAKNYEEALAKYNRAIELNPRYLPSWNGRGRAYTGLKEYDKAIADFDAALQLNARHIDSYFQRGGVYLTKGELDKAMEDYDKVIEFKPRHAAAHCNRGICHKRKGNPDEAIADFNLAIEYNPRDAFAYAVRAEARFQKGDLDDALQDANQSIQLDPKLAEGYGTRSAIYQKKKEYDNALTDAQKAIQLKPQYIEAYNLRANAYYYGKKNMKKAIEDYTEAIRLNPDYALYRKNRACAYRKLGENDKADEDEAQAEKLRNKAKQ